MLPPTNIIEKMIANRNRISTGVAKVETTGLGFGSKGFHLETVTNSDHYLNSAFTVPPREQFTSVSSR